MKKETIVLSILVITHNQEDLICRCIDSILAQNLSVSFEILIGDDRSTDNTSKIIETYTQKYPDLISGYKCNSNECNPVTLAERCGWNKAQAYLRSSGKFFVHIDADDYLKSNDILQLQVDMLEKYPTASMCMQRVWQVNNGDNIGYGFSWPLHKDLENELILTPSDIILKKLRGLNQSYMIRRNDAINPIELYGKQYDDTIITLHHLQFGNVIYIDRADYVWVQYKNSINSSLQNDDKFVTHNMLPLHHIYFIPLFAGLLLKDGLQELIQLTKKTIKGQINTTQETKNLMQQFDGFLFKVYTSDTLKYAQKIRLYIILYVLLLIRKFDLDYPICLKFAFCLMVNKQKATQIPNKQWKIE